MPKNGRPPGAPFAKRSDDGDIEFSNKLSRAGEETKTRFELMRDIASGVASTEILRSYLRFHYDLLEDEDISLTVVRAADNLFVPFAQICSECHSGRYFRSYRADVRTEQSLLRHYFADGSDATRYLIFVVRDFMSKQLEK